MKKQVEVLQVNNWDYSQSLPFVKLNMEENKNLYWYGLKPKLKQIGGKLLIFIGIVISLIGIATEIIGVIIGVITIIAGIELLLNGSSERFDYQRKSGHIIHYGDK